MLRNLWRRLPARWQREARDLIELVLVPGLAIALMVLGCNLLGDGLRDYLDPRRELKRR